MRAVQLCLHVTVKAHGVAVELGAITAQHNPVMKAPLCHRFSHGQAAKDQRLHQQGGGIGGEIHIEPTRQGTALKQNGFLWQPVHMAPCGDVQFGLQLPHFTGLGAIGAFSRLGGQGQGSTGPDTGSDPHVIAAGDATGRIDQHRLEACGFYSWKQTPERARLPQPPQNRPPRRLLDRKVNSALRPWLAGAGRGHRPGGLLRYVGGQSNAGLLYRVRSFGQIFWPDLWGDSSMSAASRLPFFSAVPIGGSTKTCKIPLLKNALPVF